MPVKIPFGIQTYRRSDIPQIRLVNMYAESVPQGKDQVVLLPRPALVAWQTLGSGPINGMFQQSGIADNSLFTLSGSQLFKDAAPLGAIDGTGIAQFAGADNAVLVANGASLYRATGTTLAKVAFPDDAQVSSVAYLGGYSIAARQGSRRLYFTLNSTTWDGLDYVSAEQSTEAIVGISVLVDQLAVFCTRHTEFFYITGDADAPLQRIPGRVFDKGAKSRESIVRMDNSVLWVGSDNIVYRADTTPVRISDHGIEERIGKSTTATAWSYPWQGHLFYVLQLDDGTIACDMATKQWHELASYSRDRWRGRTGILATSGMVVGDDLSGQLYTLTENSFRDADELIVRRFTAIVDGPAFIDTLNVDVSNADENDEGGLLEMRTSRDNGKTWLPFRGKSLGLAGKTRTRPMFRRLGLVDQTGMVIDFRLTSSVASRVSSIRINDVGGGRAR